MNLKTAERLVQGYGAALTKLQPGDLARSESWLPADKIEILIAFKLLSAFMILNGTLDEDTENQLIGAISGIGSFVPDKKANQINQVIKMIREGGLDHEVSSGNLLTEYIDFSENMVDLSTMNNFTDFIAWVKVLDRNDPIYFQRVFTKVGIEYSPEKVDFC